MQADMPSIATMIQELADFEKESAANKATHEKLLATINYTDDVPIGADATPGRKVAYVFVATVSDDDAAASSGRESIAGMALFFYNYSTWLATPGVYLEDLFVRPPFRRRGIATLLFGALAEEASRVSDGQGRLELNCLKWNDDALAFYRRIGGNTQDEWIGVRIEGQQKLEYVQRAAKALSLKNQGA